MNLSSICRIVAVGQHAMQCYVPNSARVNNFADLVPNGHIVSVVHIAELKCMQYSIHT